MRKSDAVSAILAERRASHGEFKSHAATAQQLKRIMHGRQSWAQLDDDMAEALEMIQHKAARVLNGDPRCVDHWRDIAGYAELVARRLESEAVGAQTKS